MKAIILAAGLGTRLRPLTDFIPKPLLPVAGVPNIVRLINHLRNCGIREIKINLHHLASAIPDFLGDGNEFGVALKYYPEPDILGTGGGIKKMMQDDPAELFLVVNGDVLFTPDFSRIIAHHREKRAIATIVTRRSPNAETLGAVAMDADSRVQRLVYGGDMSITDLMMFTGVHVLSPDVVPLLPDSGCIVRKTYIPMVERGEKLFAVIDGGYFCDLGTPGDFLSANIGLVRGDIAISGYAPPSPRIFVGRNVTVSSDATIHPGTCLCDGSFVEGTAVLENAVVLPGATVKTNVSNAIVCPDGTIVTA